MNELVNFTIDKKECMSTKGKYLVDAAAENGIYIPTLCNITGIQPRGACRLCTVKVNGKLTTACTTPVYNNMEVENESPELQDLRKSIIELMFADGNHYCPYCEKSGDCELQAIAYRYRVTVPRFPYSFPKREIEAGHPLLAKDHNRCILCKRCIKAVKDDDGRSIFAFARRSHKLTISVDTRLSHVMSPEKAAYAAEICPVGAILLKGAAFKKPIGERKYDKKPIGTELEM
ncbi:MAG: (2Fe-2S)-binding protein [Cyclobacteriaceae bacterium]|nr:(2Fe-2S)-binding protein [Cyclobacteriaceae bacterium]